MRTGSCCALFCCGHIDGSVQDCSNSIANALKLQQSCTKPSIFSFIVDSRDSFTHLFARFPSLWLDCPDASEAILTNAPHYNHVIMGAIASQITSLTIVYSIVYSDADQIKHQSSASLAFVRGIHRGPVNSPHKWPVVNAENVSIWWRHHAKRPDRVHANILRQV